MQHAKRTSLRGHYQCKPLVVGNLSRTLLGLWHHWTDFMMIKCYSCSLLPQPTSLASNLNLLFCSESYEYRMHCRCQRAICKPLNTKKGVKIVAQRTCNQSSIVDEQAWLPWCSSWVDKGRSMTHLLLQAASARDANRTCSPLRPCFLLDNRDSSSDIQYLPEIEGKSL